MSSSSKKRPNPYEPCSRQGSYYATPNKFQKTSNSSYSRVALRRDKMSDIAHEKKEMINM
jgi:hypothetical protein